MGYNLDFSAWKDMRKAEADSILNQASIAANLTAQRANTVNKVISNLAGVGGLALSDYMKGKEQEQMFDVAAKTGLVPEMADEEALANLTDDELKTYRKMMMQKYFM